LGNNQEGGERGMIDWEGMKGKIELESGESYEDLFVAAEIILAERLEARMYGRVRGAESRFPSIEDLNREAEKIIGILCKIKIPGKPPRYVSDMRRIRKEYIYGISTNLKKRQLFRRILTQELMWSNTQEMNFISVKRYFRV
jgi:hypothetical protein